MFIFKNSINVYNTFWFYPFFSSCLQFVLDPLNTNLSQPHGCVVIQWITDNLPVVGHCGEHPLFRLEFLTDFLHVLCRISQLLWVPVCNSHVKSCGQHFTAHHPTLHLRHSFNPLSHNMPQAFWGMVWLCIHTCSFSALGAHKSLCISHHPLPKVASLTKVGNWKSWWV